MPTASLAFVAAAPPTEEAAGALWPPPRQDRRAPRPPRVFTFARSPREFHFSQGEAARAAAAASGGDGHDDAPLGPLDVEHARRVAVEATVHGGALARARRMGLRDREGPDVEYDYRHLYAIGHGTRAARFAPRTSPHAPPASNAPAAAAKPETAAPVVSPVAAMPPTSAAPTIPRAPRFCSASASSSRTALPMRATEGRTAGAASSKAGERRARGWCVGRPSVPQNMVPPAATTTTSSSSSTTPRGCHSQRCSSDLRLQSCAIDDCVRRHIAGSTFGAPRFGRSPRSGTGVDLHRARLAPGPGAYRIRSTFDPDPLIQTTRGCRNARLF